MNIEFVGFFRYWYASPQIRLAVRDAVTRKFWIFKKHGTKIRDILIPNFAIVEKFPREVWIDHVKFLHLKCTRIRIFQGNLKF